jgi:hypothetical protein
MMLLLAAMLLAPQLTFEPRPPPPRVARPEDRFSTIAFDPTQDAATDLEVALRRAQLNGKRIIVIMGANWCHDSASLANLLGTQRFVGMINDRYEVVYVDSGTPQTGKGRNLDIAERFGVKKVKSTPLVLVLSPDGKLLNSRKDALSWRNAASRSEDAIFAYFDNFTPT